VLIAFFIVAPRLGFARDPMYVALEREQVWYWTYLCDWRIALNHPPFTTYLTPFWTLSIEEQFYLAWPFVVWAGSARTVRRIAWGIIIGACVLRVLAVVRNPYTSATYGLLPFRLDALAVGALLALSIREPDGVRRLARWVAAGRRRGGDRARRGRRHRAGAP